MGVSRFFHSPDEVRSQIRDVLAYTKARYGDAKAREYSVLILDALRLIVREPLTGRARPEIRSGVLSRHIQQPGRKALPALTLRSPRCAALGTRASLTRPLLRLPWTGNYESMAPPCPEDRSRSGSSKDDGFTAPCPAVVSGAARPRLRGQIPKCRRGWATRPRQR